MPKRLTDGWLSGLGAGFRDSGHFLGATVPIAIVVLLFVVVIGGGIWIRSCMKGPDKPKPCADYSYKMDLIGDSEAKCTRWPAMKMSIDKRILGRDIVNCKCTSGSFPPPEKLP